MLKEHLLRLSSWLVSLAIELGLREAKRDERSPCVRALFRLALLLQLFHPAAKLGGLFALAEPTRNVRQGAPGSRGATAFA